MNDIANPAEVKPYARLSEIVAEFQDTLLTFSETVLFNGHRNGEEWVVSNLENDFSPGEGSCHVNLRSGVYYDFNPSATNRKGGPIDLWKSIFGIAETSEALRGMQQWNETGALPNGVRANPRGRLAKTREEEADALLLPSDDLEKKWLAEIKVYRHWIEHYDSLAERGWRDRPGETVYWNDKKASKVNWKKVARKKARDFGEAIRALRSLFLGHRWQVILAESRANKEEIAVLLAGYRGLSPGIFEWLIEGGYLGLIKPEVSNELEIVFPVAREAESLYRSSERAFRVSSRGGSLEYLPLPEIGTEFLGLYRRWFKGEFGEGGAWAYYPKGLTKGLETVPPLIVGDLRQAEVVLLAESQWDAFAFADVYALHRGIRPFAMVATRGSANSALQLAKIEVRKEAVLFAILQNDEANAKWHREMPLPLQRRARMVRPPAGIKDLNDWAKTSPPAIIREALKEKK